MTRTSGKPLRNRRGAFATPLSAVDLYPLVREIAELAVELGDDPLKDPATVSQRGWDNASRVRASQTGRTIPEAREICVRLHDYAERAFPWGELLATVFQEKINFTQFHAARLSEPDRAISDRHVYWALTQIAHERDQSSLRPNEYEAGRQQLLEQAGRHTPHRRALERALPTRNQIATHSGGWDRALEIAGLEPRAATPPRVAEALAVPDAIGLFFLFNGHLPSVPEFKAFLEEKDLACQASANRPWKDWCADAAAQIRQQGLSEPNPYPNKGPPLDWQPVDLDLSGFPRRRISDYSRLQTLEAVYEFKLALRAAETPTDRRYKAFARGKYGVPDLIVLTRHGGLTTLLRELAQPDWHEKALQDEQTRQEEIAIARAAADEHKQFVRKQRRRQRQRRNPETRMRFLTQLRDRGPLANRELAEALNLVRMSVWKLFSELEQRGLVETTEENPRSPSQRYRLTAAGDKALLDEPTLRDLLARPLREPTSVDR